MIVVKNKGSKISNVESPVWIKSGIPSPIKKIRKKTEKAEVITFVANGNQDRDGRCCCKCIVVAIKNE